MGDRLKRTQIKARFTRPRVLRTQTIHASHQLDFRHQYTPAEIEEKRKEYKEKMIKCLGYSTMFMFALWYFDGELEKAAYELTNEVKAQGLYKMQVKKCVNEINELVESMNVQFRIVERVRILPTLSYKLKTFANEYPDIGAVVMRVQNNLSQKLAKQVMVLKACCSNRSNNETTMQNKALAKYLYYISALTVNVRVFSEAVLEAIQMKLGPDAKHEVAIENIVKKFRRICFLCNSIQENLQKGVKENDGYWSEQTTTAIGNINNILLTDETQDCINEELGKSLTDYAWWWLARMVMYFKVYDYTSVGLSEDLAAAIPKDALLRGRIICRLKNLARKIPDYEDIHDLIDEIQEKQYADLEKFVAMAVIAETDPDKIHEHVMRTSRKKV